MMMESCMQCASKFSVHSINNCECLPDVTTCQCIDIEKILKEKEAEIRNKYNRLLEKEVAYLKQKFDDIMESERNKGQAHLHNAQNEKRERIKCLRAKLECKNLSGMMFILCNERRKAQMEKQKIIADFTECLEELIKEGNHKTDLISKLLTMHKTAEIVDKEWRAKTFKLVSEFQKFIMHYFGDMPEYEQFFLDVRKLASERCELAEEECKKSKVEASKMTTCNYCSATSVNNAPSAKVQEKERGWWESVDGENAPFIVYGDLDHLEPEERRAVADKYWKKKDTFEPSKDNTCSTYVIYEKFMKKKCTNCKKNLEKYLKNKPSQQALEDYIVGVKIPATNTMKNTLIPNIKGVLAKVEPTALLGTKDSLEIASSLMHKKWASRDVIPDSSGSNYTINLQKKPFQLSLQELLAEVREVEEDLLRESSEEHLMSLASALDEVDETVAPVARFGPPVKDSILMVFKNGLNKGHDRPIGLECPDEKCQRLKELITRLPNYISQESYFHGNSFDQYEPCSPELLEKLISRSPLDTEQSNDSSIFGENIPSVHADKEPSRHFVRETPPCLCNTNDSVSEMSMYHEKIKLAVLSESKLLDPKFELNRFKVVGQDSSSTIDTDMLSNEIPIKRKRVEDAKAVNDQQFMGERMDTIRRMLIANPSLNELFISTLTPKNDIKLTVYI